MEAREFERIKGLISKAEIESAKAQGTIDNIRKNWLKEYGTDDIDEITNKFKELCDERDNLEKKMGEIWDKLYSSCNWDELERKLNG